MSRADELLAQLGRLLAAGWRVTIAPVGGDDRPHDVEVSIEHAETRAASCARVYAAAVVDPVRMLAIVRGLANVANVAGVNGAVAP